MGSHNVYTHWIYCYCVLRIGLKIVRWTETCRQVYSGDYRYMLCSDWINYFIIIIIISWRYSPGWALASATICLQVSRSLALSLHSFIRIFLWSMDTSSSYLILGLPLRLVAYSFPYIFFWDCGALHSFYMPKPSYSLAFNKPDSVLSLDYGF